MSVIAAALLLAPALVVLSLYTKDDLTTLQRDDIVANSSMRRHLLQKSYGNNGNNYNAYSAYSIDNAYAKRVRERPV